PIEFFIDQIESAETIILSRTQSATEAKIEQCVALLREHNAKSRIITTPWDQLSPAQMLDTIEHPSFLLTIEDLPEGDHDHDHDHEHHHHDHDHEHHHDHDHEHEHHHHHEHGEGCSCGCGEHHHADEIFENIGIETPKKFDEAALRDAIAQLEEFDIYGDVLRAKGILPLTDGGWLHFDYVPDEVDIRRGGADYTGRLCVIGCNLKEDAIRALFGV
ncbi:MAG: GTP-binding protein, partial [bacterium]